MILRANTPKILTKDKKVLMKILKQLFVICELKCLFKNLLIKKLPRTCGSFAKNSSYCFINFEVRIMLPSLFVTINK
jgi:hypothetical protein